MVAHREAQFVAADRQRPAADQRLVGAAVGIGDGRSDTVGVFAGEFVELDRDANRRTAGMGIEHMGAEPAIDRGMPSPVTLAAMRSRVM